MRFVNSLGEGWVGDAALNIFGTRRRRQLPNVNSARQGKIARHQSVAAYGIDTVPVFIVPALFV
jgi:hypothetical protein